MNESADAHILMAARHRLKHPSIGGTVDLTNLIQLLYGVPEYITQVLAFKAENIPAFIALMACSTGGFLLYIWAMRLTIKEKCDPYPLWVHCWMISWDCIGTAMSIYLAFHYDFFWVFVMFSFCEPIWVLMEAFCIYNDIKLQRQEEFGDIVKGEVTVQRATLYALVMIVAGFAVNLWAFSLLGGAISGLWIICPFTNYVFAFWCWRRWRQRGAKYGDRTGNSMGLQIILTVEIFLMWCPGLSIWTIICPVNQNPFFYFCGITASVIAVANLIYTAKLPKKGLLPNGKKPVW